MKSQYSSSLTLFSQKYCRTGDCSTDYYYYYDYEELAYYKAIVLNVSSSGTYVLVSSSDIDTYGYIYNDTFDSNDPAVNLIVENDNTGGNLQFQFNIFLEALTRYILVVTTYKGGTIGVFSIVATGPALISFSQMDTASKDPIYLKMLLQSNRSYQKVISYC